MHIHAQSKGKQSNVMQSVVEPRLISQTVSLSSLLEHAAVNTEEPLRHRTGLYAQKHRTEFWPRRTRCGHTDWGWQRRTGLWAHREGLWVHRTGLWAHRTGLWAQRVGLWAHRATRWPHRTSLGRTDQGSRRTEQGSGWTEQSPGRIYQRAHFEHFRTLATKWS